MNFHELVNSVYMPCCILSVEKKPGETWGEIRIITANRAYKEIMGPAYYDNMPYHELVPRDNKFEEYCFRAAIQKKKMHAYVETRAFDTWTDETLIPLESDRDDIGYCQFVFEMTRTAKSDRMAYVSQINTAEAVIQASLTLLASEDFKGNVGNVLDEIIRFSGAKGSRIMVVNHETEEAIVFCERTSPDVRTKGMEARHVIRYDLIRTWEQMIGVSNSLIIRDERDMAALEQANPNWAESMKTAGVTSLVLVPLRRLKEVIGYLYVINFDVSRVVEVKELIELTAYILGAEIYNHLLLQKLEDISQLDPLTGLYNRRAMINRLSRCVKNRPFGVVNIDLNGLKAVNDTGGHDAGDRLLIEAGEILGKVFYQEDLFRTGGDEFVVIVSGISQDTFDRKVRRLRKSMAKNTNVSFAIGEYWSDGSVNARTAFQYADERMYADKEMFYRKNPELRRG